MNIPEVYVEEEEHNSPVQVQENAEVPVHDTIQANTGVTVTGTRSRST